MTVLHVGSVIPPKNFMWRKPHSAEEFALSEVHLEEGDD